ncbi:hypothetical protein D3C87_1394030 [compost metagenome]
MCGDAVRQIAVAGRVDAVDAGAHDGDGARAIGPRVQRAFVRRGVDAQRQTADHPPAMSGQMSGECACVLLAARRGVTRAHDRQGGPLQEGGISHHVQQDGRVGDGQEVLWISRVGQRQDVAVRALHPLQRAFHQGRHVGRHGRGQLARQRVGQVAGQGGGALRVNLLGQAERAQQRTGGGGTHIGLQGQPQPGGQFVNSMRKRHEAGR